MESQQGIRRGKEDDNVDLLIDSSVGDEVGYQLSGDLSRKSFDRFASFITSELGIMMPEGKLTMVQSRLMRRARELKLKSLDDYGNYFFDHAGSEERQHLINAITTNKTDFFREPDHFNYLVSTVLPTLLNGPDGGSRRITAWSAPCSSGQEPYTIAMVLSDYAERMGGLDFSILGTDISTKVLDLARQAVYDELLTEPIPSAMRQKYLLRSRDRSSGLVRIAPAIRQHVSFAQLNFMDESYPIRTKFDVAFCRNVLIYFDRATQEAVIRKICLNLKPGGYLFIGHSESLSGYNIPAKQVHTSVFRMPRHDSESKGASL
jgi:chemotaxis protein methyltransferase CheR